MSYSDLARLGYASPSLVYDGRLVSSRERYSRTGHIVHALDALFTHWPHSSRPKCIAMSQAQPLASGARVWITSCCSFLPASVSSPFSAVSNSSCELALAQYILTAGKAHRRLICFAGKLSILLQCTRIVLISSHGILSAASEACLQFQPSPSFCAQGWLS